MPKCIICFNIIFLSVYNEIAIAIHRTVPHTVATTIQGNIVSVRCLFLLSFESTRELKQWSSRFFGIDSRRHNQRASIQF